MPLRELVAMLCGGAAAAGEPPLDGATEVALHGGGGAAGWVALGAVMEMVHFYY